jgi:hypothetical protein
MLAAFRLVAPSSFNMLLFTVLGVAATGVYGVLA